MESIPKTNEFLPALNASLNGLAAVLLLLGFILIKNGKRDLHQRVMTLAFIVSAVFLTSYLYYHFNYSSHRFAGQGAIRPVYFTMLISHVILATAMVPFILRLLYLSYTQAFERHARLARKVWPVWMYTSVTGVLVYFMLYQWFPGAPA